MESFVIFIEEEYGAIILKQSERIVNFLIGYNEFIATFDGNKGYVKNVCPNNKHDYLIDVEDDLDDLFYYFANKCTCKK